MQLFLAVLYFDPKYGCEYENLRSDDFTSGSLEYDIPIFDAMVKEDTLVPASTSGG